MPRPGHPDGRRGGRIVTRYKLLHHRLLADMMSIQLGSPFDILVGSDGVFAGFYTLRGRVRGNSGLETTFRHHASAKRPIAT